MARQAGRSLICARMPDAPNDQNALEMARAEDALLSLGGEAVPALTVHSLKTEDAPFLGRIVSKLSPMIGNLLEARLIELLDEDALPGFRWIRQDPGFPDAALIQPDGMMSGMGYEVKAWYVLSTELTGRFRESANLLAARGVRVVIVAWMLDHVVFGTPKVLDVITVAGQSVAEYRDRHYHNPPAYITVEPGDTTARTRNLQQTNVNGYRLQETDAARLTEAARFARHHEGYGRDPHSLEAQRLSRDLMNRFNYRLDTNFAKIDRIDHPDIEAFKARVLGFEFEGRTVVRWVRILKALNDETNEAARNDAEVVIKGVYGSLT